MERKRCVSLQRQDKIKRRNNVKEMKSAFTHWADLEAARDGSFSLTTSSVIFYEINEISYVESVNVSITPYKTYVMCIS